METIERKHESNSTRIVLGIILIAISALLLIDNFDISTIHWKRYIFTWQALIIVIGLLIVSKQESRITGIILIAVGAFFLLAKFYPLPIHIGKLIWPAVILLIGISLISTSSHRKNRFNRSVTSDDIIDDVNIFSGSEQQINSQNFLGGKITSIFGGSTIDLTKANLAPGSNIIDILCIFGGAKIIIPTDWKLKIETVSIFGGVSDKRKMPETATANKNELVIKGFVLFGGCDIKSY